MRVKSPPQPLVFRFSGAEELRAAASALHRALPGAAAGLSVYGGRLYLAVWASLGERALARRAVRPPGEYLGPCRVLYAYFAEHGRELSRDALAELNLP